tara:strand:- start:713 stop:1861 length:1149 start_codon:yes stop_codon:yes gene_type:complete
MQRANSTGSTLGADPHTHHSPQTDTQAATKKAATVDASTEEGKKALETLEALTSRPETKENRGRKAQAEIGAESRPKSIELLIDAKLLRKTRGGKVTPSEMGVRALETSSFDLSARCDWEFEKTRLAVEVDGVDENTGIENLSLRWVSGRESHRVPMRYDYNVDNVRTYSHEALSRRIWDALDLPSAEDDSSPSQKSADGRSIANPNWLFWREFFRELGPGETGVPPPLAHPNALPVFVQLKVNPPVGPADAETEQEDHVDVDAQGEYFNTYVNCFHAKTVDAKMGAPTVCGVQRDIPRGWALSHDSAYVHRAGRNASGENRYLAMVTWIACERVGEKTYKMPPIPGLRAGGPKWHKELFERRTGARLVFGMSADAKKRKRK